MTKKTHFHIFPGALFEEGNRLTYFAYSEKFAAVTREIDHLKMASATVTIDMTNTYQVTTRSKVYFKKYASFKWNLWELAQPMLV